jgi:tRNA dimethylallyltransferase
MSSAPAAYPSVVLIMGPTGAGKTDLALRLAERLPVEIVSVDSAMVYRGLDVGTGKPPRSILQRYPHHLVDILDPADAYSAGQFVRDAERAIAAIRSRGRLPLCVGGTMLYFRALRHGLAELPSADADTRAQLDAEAQRRGWPALHAELAAIDPAAAARIQPNDSQRIQRALEIFRLSGKTVSELHAVGAVKPKLDCVAYAWSPSDRSRLYTGIEARFEQMMQAGLLAEVERLYGRGDLHPRLPAIRSVGYRQLWEHLSGASTLDAAVRNAVLATRHLARRQLVWLRKESDLNWVDALDCAAAAHIERKVASVCRDAGAY